MLFPVAPGMKTKFLIHSGKASSHLPHLMTGIMTNENPVQHDVDRDCICNEQFSYNLSTVKYKYPRRPYLSSGGISQLNKIYSGGQTGDVHYYICIRRCSNYHPAIYKCSFCVIKINCYLLIGLVIESYMELTIIRIWIYK